MVKWRWAWPGFVAAGGSWPRYRSVSRLAGKSIFTCQKLRCCTIPPSARARQWKNTGRRVRWTHGGRDIAAGSRQVQAGASVIYLPDQAQIEAIGGCVLSRANGQGGEMSANGGGRNDQARRTFVSVTHCIALQLPAQVLGFYCNLHTRKEQVAVR